MDIKEYESRKNELHKEFSRRKSELDKEYALSNDTVKIGDTVTDHIGSIVVESIAVYGIMIGEPRCTYYGKNLLKSGKQSKRDPHRTVYQTNIKPT